MKRALLSVSDKTGLVEFATMLVESGYELISTGGTYAALQAAYLPVMTISEVTGFPEILDGRVKTLHPNVHGGLLAILDNEAHRAQITEHGITPIDLVCVNLYPFAQTIANPDAKYEACIEQIDIGGPSMLRSAAKNHERVIVVCDPSDYQSVGQTLVSGNEVDFATRQRLAAKVYSQTAMYDTMIATYLHEQANVAQTTLTVTATKKQTLRYGENPHQQASFYQTAGDVPFSLANATQLHGKELSYNNIQDTNAALEIVSEFNEPVVAAVKHMNPCGVGIGETIELAWERAYLADPTSIFGGIIATNQEVTAEVATQMHKIFLEVIIAPSFSPEAVVILTQKANLRLLTTDMSRKRQASQQITPVIGGFLVQDANTTLTKEYEVVTKRQPTIEEIAQLQFAWKIVKHVKSNAIVLANEAQTVGVGAGQLNRVGAAHIAIEQAGEKAIGSVLASDAFFPMPDTIEAAAAAGIKAIIQPGGSIKDADSIAAADHFGIAMIFTGERHFKH
ncbi:MAG: bifunctional phosphoribosylaminoimidazolecarboxamide formyltransferase/IMP cyclohydrolase [Culicoidibacterales bacterium]